MGSEPNASLVALLGNRERSVSQGLPSPLVVWRDPESSWRELLRATAQRDAFELWCDGEQDLV